MTGKKWGLVGLGLVLAVSACSSSGHHSASATSSTTTGGPSAPTSPTSAVTPSTAASSTTDSTPGTTASPASRSNRCPTSALTGSLTNPNGAAGSVYYTLQLTNEGSTSCVLQGWPGVSFVTGQSGSQVGAAAARISGASPTVTLAPGASAGANLQITVAANFGSGCQVTPVSGLRVYPPDQTASMYVAHSDNACANTSDVTLHVGAFQPAS